MNHEQIVRDFLALFHTQTLDVAALRSMLADDARYQPIVPIAPIRQGADAICGEMERQYKLYDALIPCGNLPTVKRRQPMSRACLISMRRAKSAGGANIGMRLIAQVSSALMIRRCAP
jgi:hypothetical protein